MSAAKTHQKPAFGAPEYLRVDEVAELLRTSTKAIYTMIDRGALAGVRRVGRRVLVKRSELLASIERCAPSSRRSR